MLVDTYDTACFTKYVQCHARIIPVILIIINHYDQENPVYLIQCTYSKTTSVITMTVIALKVHSLCQRCKPRDSETKVLLEEEPFADLLRDQLAKRAGSH